MKTFSLANAPHLPVTGESHPLIKESTRWLTTSNAVVVMGAMILFGGLYAWSQMRPDKEPEVLLTAPVDWNDYEPTPPRIAPTVETPREHAPAPDDKLATPEPVKDDQATDNGYVAPGDWSAGTDDGIGNDPIAMPPFQETPRDTLVPFDELPVLLSMGAPVYPHLAKEAGIDGTVLVKVFISRMGKVRQAVAVEGPDVLRNAAADAAMTAVFKPALQGDRPVDVWVTIPITFSLNR